MSCRFNYIAIISCLTLARLQVNLQKVMLELISTSWPNGQLISRPRALIGGPAQEEAGGPLSRSPIKRRWGLTAHNTRFAAATVPHLKTLTQSERVGCSGGKRHQAITDAPDPRRSSTGVAAIVLDTATTSSLRVAALAQILTDEPAVAPGERK